MNHPTLLRKRLHFPLMIWICLSLFPPPLIIPSFWIPACRTLFDCYDLPKTSQLPRSGGTLSCEAISQTLIACLTRPWEHGLLHPWTGTRRAHSACSAGNRPTGQAQVMPRGPCTRPPKTTGTTDCRKQPPPLLRCLLWPLWWCLLTETSSYCPGFLSVQYRN